MTSGIIPQKGKQMKDNNINKEDCKIETLIAAIEALNETIDCQKEIISAEIGLLADKLNDTNVALQQIAIALNEMNN